MTSPIPDRFMEKAKQALTGATIAFGNTHGYDDLVRSIAQALAAAERVGRAVTSDDRTPRISSSHEEMASELVALINGESNRTVQVSHAIRFIVYAERDGMTRAAVVVCSGCASGVGFNDAGYHQHGGFTFPCHAGAILAEIGEGT